MILPDTALQLERVTGAPGSFWLAREMAYRAHLAREARLAEERTSDVVAWVRQFPCKAMAGWGWIPRHGRSAQYVTDLLAFFRVASPECLAPHVGAAGGGVQAVGHEGRRSLRDRRLAAPWRNPGAGSSRAAVQPRPFSRGPRTAEGAHRDHAGGVRSGPTAVVRSGRRSSSSSSRSCRERGSLGQRGGCTPAVPSFSFASGLRRTTSCGSRSSMRQPTCSSSQEGRLHRRRQWRLSRPSG